MLEIRALHAGYGKVEILRGIDLDVGQGEIVAVLAAMVSANPPSTTTSLRFTRRLQAPSVSEVRSWSAKAPPILSSWG